MNEPQYLSDLRKHLDAIEYGDVVVKIKRVSHRTVEMTPVSVETVKRNTTQEYLKDLVLFIQALERNAHSGKVTLELDWKQGTINTLGYHTETKKEYRK